MSLEAELKPIGSKDDLESKNDKEDHQDQPAAAAGAGTSASKPEAVLQPIKDHI